MKNFRETLCDTFAELDGNKISVPKGTPIQFVPNAGCASGYAVTQYALLELGANKHDATYFYAYVPVNSVFEAIHARAQIETKSENWQDLAHQWQIKIAGQQFEYYTGSGIKESPCYDSVMACLIRDSEVLNMDFEEFCSEFGYDSDSRKAFAIWGKCCENGRKLVKTGIDLEAEAIRLADY
jgi:hypothetical protein